MKIRHANSKDLPELSKLIKSIIASTNYYAPRARKEEIDKHNFKSLKQNISDKKYYVCLVATKGKEIVGFAIGRNEAGVFWADWVGVKKRYAPQKRCSILNEGLGKISQKKQSPQNLV